MSEAHAKAFEGFLKHGVVAVALPRLAPDGACLIALLLQPEHLAQVGADFGILSAVPGLLEQAARTIEAQI